MSYTFLKLTNNLLKDLNEVELSESDWASAKGVQANAKDSILKAISHINTHNDQWPFNFYNGEIDLVKNQIIYNDSNSSSTIDFNSFYIEKDLTKNTNTVKLNEISEDYWSRNYRQKDLDSTSDGLDVPRFVFPASGNKIGFSPSPNNTYKVKYQYYKEPNELSLASDVTNIPTRYMNVINEGARMYFYMFYDNSEQSALAERRFFQLLSRMTRNLITKKQINMSDTRVNFGGYI